MWLSDWSFVGVEQEQEMFIMYLYEKKSCLQRSFSLWFTLAREMGRGLEELLGDTETIFWELFMPSDVEESKQLAVW